MARGSAFVLHPVADSRREGLDVDPRGAATGEGVGERRLHPGLWFPIASPRAATHRGRRFPRRASRFPFSHLGGVRRKSGEEKWQGPGHLSTNGEIKSFVLGRGQCWVQRSEGRSPPPSPGQAGPCRGQRGKLEGGFAFAKTQGSVDFIFESRATWASQL